jgi:hypothetical protein
MTRIAACSFQHWSKALLLTLCAAFALRAEAPWKPLFDGRTLNGWESIGDGVWSVMRDGTLLGQRKPGLTDHQAWLYTTRDFADFDLELEYWIPLGGNSGVSIRDTSRARYAFGPAYDRKRTPSSSGYEIQLESEGKGEYPSGSVYLLQRAKTGVQRDTDWNTLRIQSRNGAIRVYLNGQAVCEHPGDPARSKTRPIGLQLHGRSGPVMFRNIRIREIAGTR